MKPITILSLVAVLGTPLEAQRFAIQTQPRDCNLQHRRYDNPLPGVGWTMRRVEWHVLYAVTSEVVAFGAHKVFKLSEEKSAWLASNTVGVAPHVLGNPILNSYPINPPDWVFDAQTRSLPVWVVHVRKSNNWSSRFGYLAWYAAAYVAGSCYGSP